MSSPEAPASRRLRHGLAFAPALLAAALLAGCGFQPLYGTREGAAPVEALRAVQVDIIPNRSGQILRDELRTLFNPRGAEAPDLYALKVNLEARTSDVAISREDTPTRSELAVTADYALTSLDDRRVLTRGRVRSVNGFNVAASDYANIVAESDALRSNLREVARQIQTRLAIFFERQAAGLPAGAAPRQ